MKKQKQPIQTPQVKQAEDEQQTIITGQAYCNKVIIDTRQIFIYDEITPSLALEISEAMPYLRDSNRPLEIKINSMGGHLYSTMAIVSELMSFPVKIYVDITGVAMSGAAMISMAGDYIKMSRFGLYMLHQPNWPTERQSLHEHKVDVKQTELLCDRFFKELLSNTKLTFDEFKKQSKNDIYFTPRQALKLGLVHEIY